MARDGGLGHVRAGVAARPGMFAAYAAWSALEIELQALATLATLAQISTPSAAHFLKSHQLLVQKFAADRDRQKSRVSLSSTGVPAAFDTREGPCPSTGGGRPVKRRPDRGTRYSADPAGLRTRSLNDVSNRASSPASGANRHIRHHPPAAMKVRACDLVRMRGI
jgi:hypothetical protein